MVNNLTTAGLLKDYFTLHLTSNKVIINGIKFMSAVWRQKAYPWSEMCVWGAIERPKASSCAECSQGGGFLYSLSQWGEVTASHQKIFQFLQMEMVHFYALFVTSIDLILWQCEPQKSNRKRAPLYQTDVLLIKLSGVPIWSVT